MNPMEAMGGQGMFAMAKLMTFFLIFMAVGIAIAVVICFFIYDAFKRLPEQFRLMNPSLVWLLLIPCFSLVWNFFVFPRLSASYKNYFDSIGRTDVGTCGKGIGMGYAICMVCGLIPCVGFLASLAGIVLLIMYLIQITKLKNEVKAA